MGSPLVNTAPIATLEGTCEDLKEVKNGDDTPNCNPGGSNSNSNNCDPMEVGSTSSKASNSAAGGLPAQGSSPASTCLGEASQACV